MLVRTPALAAAAILLTALPVRADALDAALVRHAPAVAKAVRSLKAESVAVLKFEVKLGDQPATFDAGLANAQLAQKLENLLVLSNDPADPLLVLTGAAAKSAALPKGTTWKDAAGRTALAGITGLPLAWDKNQKLSPAAFLVGELKVSADMRTATVSLSGFTRANPSELVPLFSTPAAAEPAAVPADRGLLALVGTSFAVSRSVPTKAEGDKDAFTQAAAALASPASFTEVVKQSPVKFEVLVNGIPAEAAPDDAARGGGRVAEPKAGEAVSFRLTNTSDKQKYAVVLAVNGKNTNALGRGADLSAKPAREQRMWVLDPKAELVVPGFYTDLKGEYEPFKVLGDDASAAAYAVLGEKYRGLVTLHVFAEKADPPPAAVSAPKAADVAEEKARAEVAVLSLGIGGDELEEVRTSGTPEKAQARLRGLTHTAAAADGRLAADATAAGALDRGLIAPAESRTNGGPIEVVKFRLDPDPVAFVQLRYYAK